MAMEFLAGLAIGVIAFLVLLAIAVVIFVLWTLIDMLTARNEPTWKILWLLVMLLLPVLGSILYYFIGRKDKRRK
jgi:uncharacterized RDD family membrane protein YckC